MVIWIIGSAALKNKKVIEKVKEKKLNYVYIMK